MNEIYVVIDSSGYVESYRKFESARKDVRDALLDQVRYFHYRLVDLMNAMDKFDKDYKAGRAICSTCLGAYEIRCVKSIILED